MFPVIEVNLDDISTTTNNDTDKLGICYKFNFTTGEYELIDGKLIELTEYEAIKQWIKLLIITALDKYNIYDGTGFGNTFNKIIGRKKLPNGFLESEIKRELEAKLLLNKRIKNITEFNTVRLRSNLQINISIELIDSNIVKLSEVI